MAIQRPSYLSPTWVFQDFLYQEGVPDQLRYLQVKWDGEVYHRVSETFDYSNPPYPDIEQRGGDIVAQVDYTISGKLITINDWWLNWRDEWPLRLGVSYLLNCLYTPDLGYVFRVRGQEVYNQAGEGIAVADKEPIAFWISEYFKPLSNEPDDYLVRFGAEGDNQPVIVKYSFRSYVQRLANGAQIVVGIQPFGYPTGEVLFWQIEGEGTNAAYLIEGPLTYGTVMVDEDPTFLNIPLTYPVPIIPGGPPYTLKINFWADKEKYVSLGSTVVEVPMMP